MKKLAIFTLLYIGIIVSASAQSLDNINKNLAPVMELPPLPDKLTFAGEVVPLDNYDVRESLMREMLSVIYMHSNTARMLTLTSRYLPMIEPVLKKNGVPDDMKYLCIAESYLNQNAVSGAKAGGLWQIMPSTAKEFGLEVGETVDERFDIEKGTRVAAEYLKKEYEKFGSWSLATAAYNLGSAGVARRKTIQGVDNYFDMFLPEQTLRYVYRIIAFKLIVENPGKYGYIIKQSEMSKPLTDFRMEKISDKEIDWSAFARGHGTTYKLIREINPWIRDYTHSNPQGKTYSVKIPNKNFRTLVANNERK